MDSSTTSIPASAAGTAARPTAGRARRAAWGSFIGAVVDWYDFLLYGIVAALVFNIEFFPQISPAMGTLAAFGTFGVGFLFRPLGGIVFGHFGDKLGRKRMLMITVWTMGLSTALIGFLPTFDSIGWWAPVLLVTLRAIQGFAVGGEWGGAALLAVENAPKKKKAFYSSGVQVGYGVGLLLATGSISLVSHHTTNEEFIDWGWRLPFLFSTVLVAIAWWIRSGMEESREFVAANKKQQEKTGKKRSFPIVEALRKHPKAFLLIIALRLGELLTMYIVTAFALNYSTTNLGMPRELFLNISLLVGGISCLSIPLFARLADSFGRRRIYVTGALIGAVSAFPFFMALEAHASLWILFFAIMLANIAHDMIVSVQQPMFTELFGTAYRYSGAGVGYQVASVVGGGFTPFIAVLLVEVLGGSWHGVATYLAVGCLLSAIVGMRMKPQKLD
ncbi:MULTISPECIES: shikimate transporter [unclassified Brenneria]|uniref:shikimate transporter n=1 Tax=unclassified Brenneria TaxID=2634434 RepID=UPI0029C2123E|nr:MULTISPECIES: shikimate transporter [unclassified Brenneria]MDX5630893.1 shikimate transporter [Brenneria sp. L3-3Z]MDX5697975.1 shikimate transporter [Brenneria sp. L4-2C]MEE3664777.1 shikimate transporter [Brenneria sp. g21c3]